MSGHLTQDSTVIGRLLTSLLTCAGAQLAKEGHAATHIGVFSGDCAIEIHFLPHGDFELTAILEACAEIVIEKTPSAYGMAVHLAWDLPQSRDAEIVAVRVSCGDNETGAIYDIDRSSMPPQLKMRAGSDEHPAVRALRYRLQHVRH